MLHYGNDYLWRLPRPKSPLTNLPQIPEISDQTDPVPDEFLFKIRTLQWIRNGRERARGVRSRGDTLIQNNILENQSPSYCFFILEQTMPEMIDKCGHLVLKNESSIRRWEKTRSGAVFVRLSITIELYTVVFSYYTLKLHIITTCTIHKKNISLTFNVLYFWNRLW